MSPTCLFIQRLGCSTWRRAIGQQGGALAWGLKSARRFASSEGRGGGEDGEAASRRMQALKRYGTTAVSTPKERVSTVVAAPVASAAAAGGQSPKEGKVGSLKGDAQAKHDEELDYNEIWGDYIEYMTHQRDKGWKT